MALLIPDYSSETVGVTRTTLEKVRLCASKIIGRTTVDDFQYKIGEVPGIEGWVHEISTSLLASKIAEDRYKASFYYKTPSSWFQMFKIAHYPKWLLARHPAKYIHHKKYRTVKFTRYETYPMANMAVEKNQRTIDILGYERPIRDMVEEY